MAPEDRGRPRVAVVIPAREAGTTVGAAVASAAQEPVERIVVAVPPGDTATSVAAQAASAGLSVPVEIVDNPAGTTPAGLNAAIAAAGDVDVIVRVDAHCVLSDGYVARAVATLARTGAANVGGAQRARGETWFEEAVAAAMASPVASGGATYRGGTEERAVDTVYLGVFDRPALEEVGGFDERFRRNQDYELNVRLRQAGHTVWYDPAIHARYRPRGTVAALASQYYQYGQWRRATLREHPGSLRARQLAAPALVLGLLAGLVVGALVTWWPLIVLAGAWLAVLAVGAVAAGPLRLAPGVALAIATMHLAWGVGFLTARPGHLLARRSPAGSATA